MGYEGVDEPGLGTLLVHTIPFLASLFSDERMVIQGEGKHLMHGHDPFLYLLESHGLHGGVQLGMHVVWGRRVEGEVSIHQGRGRGRMPWSLSGTGR